MTLIPVREMKVREDGRKMEGGIEETRETNKKDTKSYIMSLFQSPPTSSDTQRANASATSTSKSPQVTLRSILNKAKN